LFKKIAWTSAVISLGLLALVIAVVVAAPDMTEPQPTAQAEERQLTVDAEEVMTWRERLYTPLTDLEISMPVVMCKNFVKDRLVAPGTVEFPWLFDEYQTSRLIDRENGYNIEGYFDAQTQFGVPIRHLFGCKVQNTTGDTWDLLELYIK
jgi:hypothetical protein